MGGRSSEHEVSLELGPLGEGSTVECEIPTRYERGAPGRDPARRGGPARLASTPRSSRGEIDVVFPVLHGPFGEDGTVQGLLELAGVRLRRRGRHRLGPSDGQGPLQVRPARQGHPRGPERRRSGPATTAESPFGFPCVVKPARLGSSVGISVVKSEENSPPAVELAFAHDEKILVEEFLDGVEVECSVLGNADPIASTSLARSSRSRATGTTTRRSTPRAGWS